MKKLKLTVTSNIHSKPQNEMVFIRRWLTCLKLLATYPTIKSGWSLFKGGLCSEMVI